MVSPAREMILVPKTIRNLERIGNLIPRFFAPAR
jgi:hypothetical protein